MNADAFKEALLPIQFFNQKSEQVALEMPMPEEDAKPVAPAPVENITGGLDFAGDNNELLAASAAVAAAAQELNMMQVAAAAQAAAQQAIALASTLQSGSTVPGGGTGGGAGGGSGGCTGGGAGGGTGGCTGGVTGGVTSGGNSCTAGGGSAGCGTSGSAGAGAGGPGATGSAGGAGASPSPAPVPAAAPAAAPGDAAVKSGPGNLFVAVKVLVGQREAQVLLGHDGTTLSEIQATTNTSMKLSEGIYPGSSLRELTVQGMSKEAVLLAIIYVLTVIVELLGYMCSGEDNVEAGGARLKLVVPAKVAASIIGVGGASVKQICHQCAVRVQVDQSPVPCGRGWTEQAVLLSGMAGAVQSALPLIFEHIALIAAEKDLYAWAAYSNTGNKIPGFTLFSGKGKGKGN